MSITNRLPVAELSVREPPFLWSMSWVTLQGGKTGIQLCSVQPSRAKIRRIAAFAGTVAEVITAGGGPALHAPEPRWTSIRGQRRNYTYPTGTHPLGPVAEAANVPGSRSPASRSASSREASPRPRASSLVRMPYKKETLPRSFAHPTASTPPWDSATRATCPPSSSTHFPITRWR